MGANRRGRIFLVRIKGFDAAAQREKPSQSGKCEGADRTTIRVSVRLIAPTVHLGWLNSTDRMNSYFVSAPGIVVTPLGSRTSSDQIVANTSPSTSRIRHTPSPRTCAIALNRRIPSANPPAA